MEQQFEKGISLYKNLYNNSFSYVTEQRITNIANLIKNVSNIHNQYLRRIEKSNNNPDIKVLLKNHSIYLKDIKDYNKLSYPLITEFNSQNDLKHFFSEHNKAITELPNKTIIHEHDKNRRINTSDSFLLKSIKRGKQVRFWFYSVFNKNKQNIRIKKRVPLKNYFVRTLYLDILPEFWTLYKNLFILEIELLQYFQDAFDKVDEKFTIQDQDSTTHIKDIINQLLERCTDTQDILSNQIKHINESITYKLNEKTNEIDNNLYKLGTIEGRTIKNSKWFINRNLRNTANLYIKQLNSLEVSLFSISEDWCFNADLFILRNKALISLQSQKLKNSTAKINFICEQLNNSLNISKSEYDKVYKCLNKDTFDLSSISDHNTNISKILTSDELFISKVNHSQTILYALNEIEQEIISEIERTNDKRMISETNMEWDKMQLSKLTSVYLKNLIKFEIQPQFSSNIELLKQNILQKIATYENEINNLVHISEYNFETITSILNDKDTDLRSESILSILEDGKEKVFNKLNEIINNLSELNELVETDLSKHIRNFATELTALTENEKVGELNLRLLKAKAISKSERIKDIALSNLSSSFKYINNLWIKIQEKGFKYSKQLVKIYSQEEVQASINNEISAFLSEIASTTEKLPFLYQRLFKLESINDGYLYFKRSKEISSLKLAYSNWLRGRFANIAITAEKGAGITSIINYTLNENKLPYTSINFQEYNNIYRQDEFIFTLSEILDLTPLNDIKLFIDELNSMKGIIVLEGLQYAYLKKVDGFETLKLLFEIISKTNKNIFWICTCTLHAWNYLNKVIAIEEYFGHVIKLGEFSNDEMIDIIKKRHQVSGYNLVYLKSKDDVRNKKMEKLSPADTQNLLEKQYFQTLNSLAKGNISIAFIFWLRSIKRIENNTLFINSMNDFNISFIRGLNQEKLFCLYAILLHDGLELDDFCKVMRFSPEQGRMKLFQMVDDGLLLEINKRYVVNLLLHRPTIDALKAKNILH